MFHWQPIRRVFVCDVCGAVQSTNTHESASRAQEWRMNETQPACVHSMLRAQHYHIVSCRLVSTRLASSRCNAMRIVFFLLVPLFSPFFFHRYFQCKINCRKKVYRWKERRPNRMAIAAAVLCETWMFECVCVLCATILYTVRCLLAVFTRTGAMINEKE